MSWGVVLERDHRLEMLFRGYTQDRNTGMISSRDGHLSTEGAAMAKGERVSFADLKKALPAERRRLIARIADDANEPANGRLDEVRDEIGRFEDAHGIDSDLLLKQLHTGEREETDDVLPWLGLITLRNRLESDPR